MAPGTTYSGAGFRNFGKKSNKSNISNTGPFKAQIRVRSVCRYHLDSDVSALARDDSWPAIQLRAASVAGFLQRHIYSRAFIVNFGGPCRANGRIRIYRGVQTRSQYRGIQGALDSDVGQHLISCSPHRISLNQFSFIASMFRVLATTTQLLQEPKLHPRPRVLAVGLPLCICCYVVWSDYFFAWVLS